MSNKYEGILALKAKHYKEYVTAQIQCKRLATTLKSKYELDETQCIALDHAIARYDYLQNDGTIFNNMLPILECFINDEKPIPPNKNCIYALCKYIIGTIQFYDVPASELTIKSNADIQAQAILQIDSMKGGV